MRRVLRCLWFFAILLTFSTLTLAQTNLVGSSTLQSGHDNNSPGEAEAFKATASNSGTVTSCSFYVDTTNTAKSVVFGIYSYSNGHPRTLLGSGSISSPIAGSWNTIPTNAIALTANATYYLTLLGLGGTIPYRDSGGTSETSLQTNLTNLPSTWSSGTSWATGNLSAYCSGNMGVTVSIAPTSVTVNQGTQQQFTATVTGTSNTAVVWSVKSGTGTISSSGLFTAPHQAETDVVQVQSQADPTKSATAMVTVPSNAVSVSISPTNIVLKQGGTQQFTASVTSCGANCAVNWSETGNGAITATGLFTAPNQQETDSVRATSQADNTKSASTSVTVPAVSITLSPMSANVQPGGTQQFTATVSGTVNTQVTYSALNGTVNPTGLYTAPASSGSDTVTATATATPNPHASASVTIQNQNQTNCGNTLNWTSSVCQVPASGKLNTAMVNGVNDPNAWTIISRHGEYSQSETECNTPMGVFVAGGALDIRTWQQNCTAGDWNTDGTVRTTPRPWPYMSGDVQWSNFNFRYGVLITRQKLPSYQTSLWPGSGWLLGTNCQINNKYTGDTGFGGCPSPGQTGYNEMDVDEFYGGSSGWPQFHIANPGWGCCGGYPTAPIDVNWHVFATVWTSNGVQQYLDGSLQFNATSTINSNLFYIFQTQTGGVGGTPNNSLLPADLYLDYVKVCNANYTLAQCTAAATDGSDSNVVFWDDFGGPAQ